jgi:hypothetical protein
MQKEYTGSIRDTENKNAGHDFYWEDCMCANTMSCWHENLYYLLTNFFLESNMFCKVTENNEERNREKSTQWITLIAFIDWSHVKSNKFLGPMSSVKYNFSWV